MQNRTIALFALLVWLVGLACAGLGQTLEEAVRRYEQGDFETAQKWLQKRAELDDAQATYYLGRMLERGEGVSRDYEAAAAKYLAAADAGVPEAQFALGGLYEFGMGVRRDPVEAKLWYQKAADQGYAPAQQALAPPAAEPKAGNRLPLNPGKTATRQPKLGAKRQANASWEFVSDVKDTLYPSLILVSSS